MADDSDNLRLAPEAVEVTITLSGAAYERAREIVAEGNPQICPPLAMDGPTTVEDYLGWLLEQRLR